MTSPRPDTRYLATSPITTDLGQRLTDLTVAAPGGYEANSARTAITGAGAGRSIEIKARIDSGGVGVLVDHGTGASYRVRVTTGGVVEFSDTNGTHASITAPNVGALSRTYVIAWSTEPNPLTTGGTDTLRSEFLVYDVAGDSLSVAVVEHATAAASGTGTLTIGGVYTGGAMTLTFWESPVAVRISCRFHTRIETREHFVAQTAAPTVVGIQACEAPPLPAEMITDGNLAGPAYQAAAASLQPTRNRYRLYSPVVLWMQAVPPSYTDDLKTTLAPGWVYDMEDGYQVSLGWVCRRRIPPTCQWLRVQVQWATWETAPGVTDLVELRVHIGNREPYYATQYSTTLISRQVDDGTNGTGVLQTFDPVWVERDDEGYSWIWLSARTDSGSGSGNATYSIRSLTATPLALGEGYNDAPPNGFGP
jgi:hypothetical protein